MLAQMLRHPREHVFARWNWKSAVLSAAIRATLFFVANLSAGWASAWGAFGAELAFRALTSGFYGAMTEAFVPVRPAWKAMVAVVLLLPAVSHTLEFAVHWARGTPELTRSIALSVGFTVVSTAFNLFAMRRGVLVVGQGARPLAADLRRIPRLIGAFISTIFRVPCR